MYTGIYYNIDLLKEHINIFFNSIEDYNRTVLLWIEYGSMVEFYETEVYYSNF